MNVSGLKADFHITEALKSRYDKDGNEQMQKLPPHGLVTPYVVDEYPACPDSWMHGSEKASSYFCVAEAGKGMWLDFNANIGYDYNLGILISVQGINPITGQKQNKMRLEQYKEKCPVHEVSFEQDRYCPKCKYKWDAQNYLATSVQPENLWWIDGFRQADGVVRQYIISEDESKGVAAQVIGKERVYAVGVAFFKTKKKRKKEPRVKPAIAPTLPYIPTSPTYPSSPNPGWGQSPGKIFPSKWGPHYQVHYDDGSYAWSDNTTAKATDVPQALSGQGSGSSMSAQPPGPKKRKRSHGSGQSVMRGVSIQSVTPVSPKKLEVAAGAMIGQRIYADTLSLDKYETEPVGFIYINYTDRKSVESILAQGKREESSEGFMAGLKVGND